MLTTNNNITPTELSVLTTATTKSVRYHVALAAITNNELCKDYVDFKPTYKFFAQQQIKEGATSQDLTTNAKEQLKSADVTGNIAKKVTRYEKKLGKGGKQLEIDPSVKTFEQAQTIFKVKFDAVQNDPEAKKIYREFRIAKKGLPEDPEEGTYVGFFKYIKEKKVNQPIVKKFAAELKVMCKEKFAEEIKINEMDEETRINNEQKIFKKIDKASSKS